MPLIISDSASTKLHTSDAAYTRLVVADVVFLGSTDLTLNATASIVGLGSVMATGSTILSASGSFIGILATTATGTTVLDATGSVIGTAYLSATGEVIVTVNATASVIAIGSASATASTIINADGSTLAFGIASATATSEQNATGSVAALALVTASGTTVVNYDGSVIAIGAVSATASTVINATGSVAGLSLVAAVGSAMVHGAGGTIAIAALSATASVSAAAVTRYPGRQLPWASKPSPATLIDRSHNLSQALGLCLNFAEGSGNIAQNAVPGGRGALLTTAAWSAHGLSTSSSGGYGTVANNSLINDWLVPGATLIVRLKSNQIASAMPVYTRLVEKGANNELTFGFHLDGVQDGKPAIQELSTTSLLLKGTIDVLTDKKTHEVAYTIAAGGETPVVKIYIDGILNASATSTETGGMLQAYDFHIAHHQPAPTTYNFDGRIELIRFYKRQLSSAEIAQHWVAPYSMMTPTRR